MYTHWHHWLNISIYKQTFEANPNLFPLFLVNDRAGEVSRNWLEF